MNTSNIAVSDYWLFVFTLRARSGLIILGESDQAFNILQHFTKQNVPQVSPFPVLKEGRSRRCRCMVRHFVLLSGLIKTLLFNTATVIGNSGIA